MLTTPTKWSEQTANLPPWLSGKMGEQIQVDEAKAKVVLEIFRLCAAGYGKRAIARKMTERGIAPLSGGREWNNAYIGRLLTRRAVLGERTSMLAIRNNGGVRTNYYPQIVDAELWQTAQAALTARIRGGKSNRQSGRTGKVINLFRGLVDDMTTGEAAPMYLVQGRKGDVRLTTEKKAHDDKPRWIDYRKFEAGTIAFLRELNWQSILGESESAELKEAKATVANLKLAIEQGAAKVEKMLYLLLDTPSPALKARLADPEARLTQNRAELAEVETTLTTLEARHAAILDNPEAFKNFAAEADEAGRMQLRAEIQRKIAKIEFQYGPGKLESWKAFSADLLPAYVTITFVNGATRRFSFLGDQPLIEVKRKPGA